MTIKTIVVGYLQVNCFVISDEISKDAIVVDPGDEPEIILNYIADAGLSIAYIVCTHGHFDHVGAIPELKIKTGAPVLMHKDEIEIYGAAKDMAAFWGYELEPLPDPDVLLNEGDVLKAGNLSFEVIHTPGHSPGGLCLYIAGLVITGDTLFAGSVGRTDFYGGDINKLKMSFRKLMSLPDNTRVLCGHGAETSIGREKNENMFAGEFMI